MTFLRLWKNLVFDSPFVRKNLVGIAVDGQYVKCGIEKHLKSALVRDVPVTWDPMHRLELCLKHAALPKIIKDSFDLIQDSMKEFNYGKNFETLSNSAEKFNDFFYKPKLFKSMKFVAHCNTVIQTFLKDYKMLVSACENIPDLFTLRDKLITKYNIFNILLTAILHASLAITSKSV